MGADGTLYGTTFEDTESSLGKIYKLRTDGSDYAVLKYFRTEVEAYRPRWLVLVGGVLYGSAHYTSELGPDRGIVFRLNTDGSGYTVLKAFAGEDGTNPMGLVLDQGTIYGTTMEGGISNNGTLFRINTDGGGFTVLKEFEGADGAVPRDLMLSGTTLFGVTSSGGISNQGTIFRIQTDGTGFAVLKAMEGPTDGVGPVGPLVLSGTTLYGAAYSGGPLAGGTIFKMNTDGTGFEVLTSLTFRSDGHQAAGGLVLSGTRLYGATMRGTNVMGRGGAVFQLNTDGSGFQFLKIFTSPAPSSFSDGYMPWAPLCLLSGTELFGTTEWGGSGGHGVVFKLSMTPPVIITPPESQTVEEGNSAQFRIVISGSLPLTYRWFSNGTNLNEWSTNRVLVLTNCQSFHSGWYTAVVTNMFGTVTSPPATLNVIAPVARRPVPGLNLTGEIGALLNVESSDSLSAIPSWLSLETIPVASPPQWYFDLSMPLPAQRFYRAWQTGAPNVLPALTLPGMVPALTLTGAIGGHVRVDAINQIGPTEAWFTLDTVTLTNTTQFYFDTTSLGQPARLYRLVPMP